MTVKTAVALLLILSASPTFGEAVFITAFTARPGEKTSIGTKPMPWRTIAVSRDMKYLVGRKVVVKWKGRKVTGRVESVTHWRLKRTVDVLVARKSDAKKFEKKKGEIHAI